MRSLITLLSGHESLRILTGWSGAETWYIPSLMAYLKIAPAGGPSDLPHERDVLAWLENKLPVPRVLGFEEAGDKHLILLSAIRGVPGSEYVAANLHDARVVERHVEMAARAMRTIHEISIDDCPFRQVLDVKLPAALENIRCGFVDESDFDAENEGKTAEDVLSELVEKRPATEDLVFTHGDLCLPNYLVENGEITGFIDFDRAGIADRYQDIALFLRSVGYNSERKFDMSATFLRAYGLDSLDEEKLYYYRLLDELF